MESFLITIHRGPFTYEILLGSPSHWKYWWWHRLMGSICATENMGRVVWPLNMRCLAGWVPTWVSRPKGASRNMYLSFSSCTRWTPSSASFTMQLYTSIVYPLSEWTPSRHLSLYRLPLKAGNLLAPSAWALSSRPLSYPLPYCKEGLVTFTRRTSAQAVPVCVRVLTAPPTLYIKSRCRLNTSWTSKLVSIKIMFQDNQNIYY